jgi:hypothetical protein
VKRPAAAVATTERSVAALPRELALQQGSRDLEPLRRRLAGATAREAVLVDFLEDDLREAEAAIAELGEWLSAVSATVRDPGVTRHDLMALAARSQGADGTEYLGSVLASVRRRIAHVAVSLARAEAEAVRR